MNTINNYINKYSSYSGDILRIILGLVFIYFGWTSITTPDMWTSYVPTWTNVLGTAVLLVKVHGVVEIVLGLMLVLKIKVRMVAGILFLDLLHILTLLNFGPVWIRDMGLAGSMLSLIFLKQD